MVSETKQLPPARVIRETPHWCSSCGGTGWRNCHDNEGEWVERCGCVDGIFWGEEEIAPPAPAATGDVAAELDQIAADLAGLPTLDPKGRDGAVADLRRIAQRLGGVGDGG